VQRERRLDLCTVQRCWVLMARSGGSDDRRPRQTCGPHALRYRKEISPKSKHRVAFSLLDAPLVGMAVEMIERSRDCSVRPGMSSSLGGRAATITLWTRIGSWRRPR